MPSNFKCKSLNCNTVYLLTKKKPAADTKVRWLCYDMHFH